MELKVNEIFYSLQGEGARNGAPSIFIRLSDCDLACGFCDTEFISGEKLTPIEILNYLESIAPQCKWIVWTGGEPLLQLKPEITAFFKKAGYSQAVETNGNVPYMKDLMLDWITLSPKVAEHVVEKNFPQGVTELKYVRHKGQLALPEPKVKAKFYFLSPLCDGNRINPENLNHCIYLCQKDPKWRLSIQQHKIWKVL